MKRVTRRQGGLLGAVWLTLAAAPAGAQALQGPSQTQGPGVVTTEVSPPLDVPYVPTPQTVVDGMLDAAGVKPGDRLYDLGSGDGRIVITAAKRFGVRGTGVDRNPERIAEANENARQAGVQKLVDFRQEDLFKTDFADATVVTLYLLPEVNERLRPKLLSELAPGTRIVSHAFDMGDWKPERTLNVDGRTIYVWTVPEQEASIETKR